MHQEPSAWHRSLWQDAAISTHLGKIQQQHCSNILIKVNLCKQMPLEMTYKKISWHSCIRCCKVMQLLKKTMTRSKHDLRCRSSQCRPWLDDPTDWLGNSPPEKVRLSDHTAFCLQSQQCLSDYVTWRTAILTQPYQHQKFTLFTFKQHLNASRLKY